MSARKRKVQRKKNPPQTPEELRELCGDLARQPRILDVIAADAQKAYFAGPIGTFLIVVLAMTSRLLPRPVSVAVRGPSSAGKSYLMKRALDFLPPEAFMEMTAMSPKALAYMEASLKHRVLVIYEGAGVSGDFVSYAVRSLLSEGRLEYVYTDFESRKTRTKVVEGPTGLLTSTAGTVDPELNTRMFNVNVADDPGMTKAILRSQGQIYAGKQGDLDFSRYHALQRLIAIDPPEVIVPFAEELAEGVDAKSVRMRRDFPALMALVSSNALLHRDTRETDQRGRLIATLDDYAVVHDLVGDIIAEGAEQAVPSEIRETVEAVGDLYYRAPGPSVPVSVAALANKLELNRATVTRRVNRAVGLGYLVDDSGGRRGIAKKLAPGDGMPTDTGVIPVPDALDRPESA